MGGTVRFILGRAGTGKSRVIQDRIISLLRADPLGPPVYLLVPGQATFIHERYYALGAGLEGYARLRVVGFDQLGADVIAECGGDALGHVTSAGRQMLLGHLLRRHADELEFFGGVARQLGLVQELDRTFAEFERAGRSSAELREALEAEAGPANPPPVALGDVSGDALLAKTRDLARLGAAYAEALGPERLDATRRLEHVMRHLDGCRGLRDAHLFVDGFHRFSAFERKLLAKVAGLVRQTWIALTLDPQAADHVIDPQDLFYPTVTAWRQLRLAIEEAGVPLEPALHLETARRFSSPGLGLIERHWPMPRPPAAPAEVDCSGIRLIEAPDQRAQADAAARQVKDWALEGLRLREIAVLARDLPTMQPLLEAAFREHDLPFFIDRRRPAAHHPLVRFVRSLLRVAMHNWPHEAVMDLCKCGLAGMSLSQADLLENYALEHRIRGRKAWTSEQPWQYRSLEDDEEGDLPPLNESAARAERLRRRLVDAIVPFTHALRGQPCTVREHINALWQCITRFKVPRRLARWIDDARSAQRLEEAAEHAQAWEQLINLLDQAADLLGEEKLDGADFVATLEYGLDLLDLAIVPPNADEVILGDVERTRVVDCRAAVVLGLNDGTFPRASVEDSVLSDEDRRILREQGVDVEPDGSTRQLAERFLAYTAFTTPSERLTLLRAGADDAGRAESPSPFWEQVRALLGVEVEQVPRDAARDPSCISTPRQLATALMIWARTAETDPAEEKQENLLAPLYQFLAGHDALDGPLGDVRRLSWRALSYANESPPLPEELAGALWRAQARTSVSRLESFAACPFRHFAGYTLGLRGRDEEDVTMRDIGSVYHGVLERLIRRCIAQKIDIARCPPEVLEKMIPELTEAIGRELRGRIMLSSGRNRYLLDRIRRTLQLVIDGQRAAMQLGKFKPFATEVVFGRDHSGEAEEGRLHLPALELKTPRGRSLQIHGQIDRIDRSHDAAVVIDYKLARRRASAMLNFGDVYHGLSLQLLTYLLVLLEHGTKLSDPPPVPVAALYVKLVRGIDSCKTPADLENLAPLDVREKPRGVIDRDHVAQLDSIFSDGAQLVPAKSDAYNAQLSTSLDEEGLPLPYASSDILTSDHFQALLEHVRATLLGLADRMMDGDISISPYRIGTRSPCTYCDFASVCRFDPQAQDYRFLERLKKTEILTRLMHNGQAVSP